MTTPSVSTDVRSPGTIIGVRRYVNRSTGIVELEQPVSVPVVYRRDFDMRPASINNPVRDDGTRRPSAWSHRWGTIVSPSGDYGFQRTSGAYYVQTLVRGVRAPGLIGNMAATMTALGVGWIDGLSGQSFPYSSESKARTNFITKLRNQDYEFGQTLGEIRESYKFVGDACKGFLDFLETAEKRVKLEKREIHRLLVYGTAGKKARKKLPRPPGRMMRKMNMLVKMWLAAQFALKPLLSDVNDAGMALSEVLSGSRPADMRVMVRSGGKETSFFTYHPAAAWSNTFTSTVGMMRTARCYISAVYEVSLTKDSRAQRWGLTNSYSVMFELCPWSWAIDYLSNTGKWLASLTPVEGADFLEGSITRVLEGDADVSERLDPVTGTVPLYGFGRLPWTFACGRMERSVLPPVGVLPAVRPTYQDKLGLKQTANLLAALSQAIQ